MSLTFLIILALTAAITFLVVMAAVSLVIHKNAVARRQRIQRRLTEEYAVALTEMLMTELPSLPATAPSSARFRQYESLLEPIKKQLQSLSRRRRRIHRTALLEVMLDYAQDLTGEAADRVVYAAYSLDYVQELIAELKSRQWYSRAQAARDLGVIGAKRAIGGLTAALEDDHPDVRFQAIQALIVLVGADALRTIFRVGGRLSTWNMMGLSVIVLRFKEDVVPHLIEGLYAADQSFVLFCIEMLAEIGFVSAVEPLRRIATDYPNVVVRAKAIEALGRLGDERAEPLLLKNASNPYPVMRLRALQALRKVGSPAALPVLEERLREGPLEEKIAAARAMARTGREGWTVLERMRKEEGKLAAAAAVQVLEELSIGGSA